MEYSLNVLYRIDSINYKIEYLNNYQMVETESMKFDPIALDYQQAYLLLIQRKSYNRWILNFFCPLNGRLIQKRVVQTPMDLFTTIEQFPIENLYIFLKNARKELSYLEEHNPDIYNGFAKYPVYCVETFLKYELCLPLFVQGKLSKRYRIPTIDEYLDKKQIKPFSPQKSDWSRFRLFMSVITVPMATIILPYHSTKRLETIPRNDLGAFIKYMLVMGFEKNHIVVLTHSKKGLVRVEGIDYLGLEQFYKHITNYKKDYQVILLDNIADTFKNIDHVYCLGSSIQP